MAVLQDISINVHGQPSEKRLQTFLRLSQNENGRLINFRVLGPPLPSNCTATFSGTKPDGNVYSKTGTVTGNFVVVQEDIQMTAVAGVWDAKLDIINGTHNIMTALIRVVVDADVVDPDVIASDSQLQGLVAEAKYYAEHARTDAYGSPLTATTAAEMTDKTRVYVYTGSETGMTAGNWYYWNGSAWTSGGVYNAVAVQTDTTLSVAGKAADAKKTGDEIASLKEMFGGELFTEQALTPISEWTQTGFKLSKDGYRVADEAYKLERYRVLEGMMIKVSSPHRWQFQTSYTVPATGTQYRVGDTNESQTVYATVPATVTYVIVSTPIDETPSVCRLTSVVQTLSTDVEAVGDELSGVKEDLTHLTPYRAFMPPLVNKSVSDGKVANNSNALAVIWKAEEGKYYSIKTTGTLNRFILSGVGADGETATEIFRYATGSVPANAEYLYHNTEYAYLFLAVYYTKPFPEDITVTVLETPTETEPNTFSVAGIEVLKPETAEEMISDVTSINKTEFEYKRGYVGSDGKWASTDTGYGVWFEGKQKWYSINAKGEHNRFVIFGSTDGVNFTEVGRVATAELTNNDSYTYHNETYTTLVLVLMYAPTNPHIPEVEVSVLESDIENFNEQIVNGVSVPTTEYMKGEIEKYHPYNVRFSTIPPVENLTTPFIGVHGNLYLIAVKVDNAYYGDAPNGRVPTPKGYLYLDQRRQKLYYSVGFYDKPEYLCDWNSEIADGQQCEAWHCTITKDGDLIFLRRPYNNRVRQNPIIYPHGDYQHPYVIDFGNDIKPFSFVTDSAVEHSYNGDFFIFAEYRGWSAEDNDTEIYIWKVVKPYNTPSCWTRVFTQYVRHSSSPEGSHPGQEIGHFHTVNWDFYSGAWIASSGDADYQCRFFMSLDNGETWDTVTNPDFYGQASRTVGVVFAKEGLYYQTDSTNTKHCLYFVGRDEDGYPDFSTQTKICDLSQSGAAGYGTALMREPYGLVLIDRMEAGPQGVDTLPLYFYDLKNSRLVHLIDAKAIEGYDQYEYSGRFGLPMLAYTHYQSPYETGIIMGGTIVTKPFTLALAGNMQDLIVGVLKEEIV